MTNTDAERVSDIAKPDDIPQDVWDAASAVVGPPDGLGYAKVFTDRIARAIIEAQSKALAEVREVKPLEWVKRHSSEYLSRAETLLGVYRVWSHHEANGKWFWSLTDGTFAASDGPLTGTVESEADAKAAAQADYQRRILSALVTPTPENPNG